MSYISTEKEKLVLEFWFEGKLRKEIAKKLKIAEGSVSNIIEIFRDNLTPKGAQFLENLRFIAVELRQSGVSSAEAVEGARLNSKLAKLGVNPNEVEYFISAAKKTSSKLGVGAEEYAKAAVNLAKLEEETCKPYLQIIKEYEDKAKQEADLEAQIKCKHTEIRELKKDIKLLKKQKQKQIEDLKENLEETKLTMEKIEYAADLRNHLQPYGYKIEDITIIPRFLKEIKACGENPAKIIKKIEETESLTWQLAKLKDDVAKTSNGLEILRNQKANLEKDLKAFNDKLADTEEKRKKELAELAKLLDVKENYNSVRKAIEEKSVELFFWQKRIEAKESTVNDLSIKEQKLKDEIAGLLQTKNSVESILQAKKQLEEECEKLKTDAESFKKDLALAKAFANLLARYPTNLQHLKTAISLAENFRRNRTFEKFEKVDENVRMNVIETLQLVEPTYISPIEHKRCQEDKMALEIQVKYLQSKVDELKEDFEKAQELINEFRTKEQDKEMTEILDKAAEVISKAINKIRVI